MDNNRVHVLEGDEAWERFHANLSRAEAHVPGINGTKRYSAPVKCPWCGESSIEWFVDDYGWDECPICGGT